jgi:hypothetical protein
MIRPSKFALSGILIRIIKVFKLLWCFLLDKIINFRIIDIM